MRCLMMARDSSFSLADTLVWEVAGGVEIRWPVGVVTVLAKEKELVNLKMWSLVGGRTSPGGGC